MENIPPKSVLRAIIMTQNIFQIKFSKPNKLWKNSEQLHCKEAYLRIQLSLSAAGAQNLVLDQLY